MSLPPSTAFFFATPLESRGLKSHLILRSRTLLFPNVFYWGHLKSHPEENLLIVETGIGPQAAAQAARHAFSQFKVSEALLLGVAAAAQKDMKAGEALLATEMGSLTSPQEHRIQTDPALREKLRLLLEKVSPSLREGTLLTVDRVIRSPEEKIELGAQWGALALEMEAYPLAQEAKVRGIPFAQLRWILDPVDFPLPPMEGWIDERGKARGWAMTKALFKRPKLIFELPSLAWRMNRVLNPLNLFLQKWFAESV